ncbi:hypothetical protein [Ktedonobacter robiniae]|uniref:Alpha/beta hydrolase fold-3 domain-containing protein n=1 Tax=Ktedonobacter robiniae TaxID=2778365 RepID=A0ABQ3USX7_9CHLR|nr:hypothetical protein [Ktedonobacter robiniae]GHO55777.1 hypothetical protein KSB_42520 [Ktedonobacter robiniae]
MTPSKVADHARATQVPVELTVWEGMWHVFQLFASILPEGQQSLEQIGAAFEYERTRSQR